MRRWIRAPTMFEQMTAEHHKESQLWRKRYIPSFWNEYSLYEFGHFILSEWMINGFCEKFRAIEYLHPKSAGYLALIWSAAIWNFHSTHTECKLCTIRTYRCVQCSKIEMHLAAEGSIEWQRSVRGVLCFGCIDYMHFAHKSRSPFPFCSFSFVFLWFLIYYAIYENAFTLTHTRPCLCASPISVFCLLVTFTTDSLNG